MSKMPEEKIRVLHILQRMDAGGKENGIVNVCNYLDRKRFKPMICCLKASGVMAGRLNPDVQIFNMNLSEGRSLLRPLVLANLFRKIKPDIVHTHSWNGGLVDGVLGSRLSNVPVVINGEHGHFGRKYYQKLIQRAMAVFCDATLSVSEELKRDFSQTVKVPLSRIKVIPNGVDTNKFSGKYDTANLRAQIYERFKFKINAGDLILGNIGSLKPGKNQKMLLSAIRRIKADGVSSNIKVIMVGEGPDRAMLEKFISDFSLEEEILLLGYRDDIPELLSLFNVLVLCSIKNTEGLSNVILEAMSSGITVISTETTGTAEVIRDNDNGFLVKTPDELIEKIKLLNSDRALRAAMGARAKEFIRQNYALEKMLQNYERVYLELLEREKVSR